MAGAGGNGVLWAAGDGGIFENNGTVIGGNGGRAESASFDGFHHGNGGVGVSGGANLEIIDSGKIAGGLSGDGTTQADAIDFSGGVNVLVLEAGYSIIGNVVAFTFADSLILGGSSSSTFNLSQLGSQFIGFGTLKIASPAWVLTTTSDFTTQLQIELDATKTGANGTVDTNGSNGTLAGLISGDGELIKIDDGVLTLSHSNNTYSGGTFLNGGTLDLAAMGAAGAGAIKFGNTGSEILKIEDAALSGHAFGNTIDSFGIHDVIDLPNLMFFKGATASYDSGTQKLTVTSGSVTDTLTLTNPGLTSLTGFVANSDGASGTKIELVLLPTAVADRTGVNVGASVTGNVLANDTDPVAGDTLHVSAVNGQLVDHTIVVAGKYGSLTLNPVDGSYTYSAPSSDVLPASGVAEDVFTYTASTGQGGTATSTLTVTVTAAGLNYVGGPPGSIITAPSGGHSPVLDGGAGNNTLVAANGATVLIGGPGDTLTGGKGTDTYVFLGHFGQDTITNYNASKDLIELDHTQFKDLAAVKLAATQAVGSNNTVITDHAGDSVTLVGVSLSQLHFDASHFLLA
jgi:autotransporter-associated beta strand protein